jgi:hypothetical protein
VADQFDPAHVVDAADGGKPHLDAHAVARAQLRSTGVPRAHIEDHPPCTKCDPLRFFSHRASRGHTGRMVALLALEGRGNGNGARGTGHAVTADGQRRAGGGGARAEEVGGARACS